MMFDKLCRAQRPRKTRLFPVVAALLCLGTGIAPAAEETKVAVFPFELIDSSLEGSMMGKNPDETARLDRLAPRLEEDIAGLGAYAVIDTTPMDERVKSVNLQSCGQCGVSFAEELGADIAVIGTVQKVSNLILNINAYAFDVASGEEIARGSADIRANTDESWSRGLAFLWSNTLKTQFESRR